MHQLELFVNDVDSVTVKTIIHLRKQIRVCERKIYKLEKRVIQDKLRVSHVLALNPDGTINFKAESVRRKLNKVYSLLKKHYFIFIEHSINIRMTLKYSTNI